MFQKWLYHQWKTIHESNWELGGVMVVLLYMNRCHLKASGF